MPHVLTIIDAAEALAVSVTTVHRLIDSGQLPAYKVGRQIRIRAADLEQVLRPMPSAGGDTAA